MIVDMSYYVACYVGEPITGEDFFRASAKAERVIKQITHGRAVDFANLPFFQQKAIKDAICAQIEYYAVEGTEISVAGQTAPEWTVGKVHVGGSRSSAGSSATGSSTMVCPAAIACLEQTGLLNPDVPVFDYPPLQGWWWNA